MNNLFFWILVLSFLIPMGLRMYRKSMARRNQDRGFPGQYPGPGHFPGDGQFPAPAAPQNRQPRDGYTQQDYFSGGFREINRPRPVEPPAPLPGLYGEPPAPPQPWQQQPAPEEPAAPATPPPPSAPQGFRARKLAELDRQYSDGDISMEEYMTRRSDIMDG
ncbi:hypothetical protein ACFWIX_07180 [Pseudarthrobacter sp. NPDC058362]|uniref:hypothetical protein n=1 Tax=Pseudarthrobacter sp. NPDC058362 TaxID=3346458 RepID=UPI003657249B